MKEPKKPYRIFEITDKRFQIANKQDQQKTNIKHYPYFGGIFATNPQEDKLPPPNKYSQEDVEHLKEIVREGKRIEEEKEAWWKKHLLDLINKGDWQNQPYRNNNIWHLERLIEDIEEKTEEKMIEKIKEIIDEARTLRPGTRESTLEFIEHSLLSPEAKENDFYTKSPIPSKEELDRENVELNKKNEK